MYKLAQLLHDQCMCRCCVQQWDIAVSLWKTAASLGNSIGCLEVPITPLWPTNQLDGTQSEY